MNHNAIRKAYPNVVTIDDSLGCFDINGDLVIIDKKLVAEAEKLVTAQRAMELKNEADKKASTLAKLAAIGITEEEFLSLFA